jgi:enoyl-CoA hydratase/carnithine racemase
MTQDYSFIRYSTVRHVGWLDFNRPPVNAFNRQMVDEVHDCIMVALGDPAVRVLVLASAVDAYFSAGADLTIFKGLTQALARLIGRPRAIRLSLLETPNVGKA